MKLKGLKAMHDDLVKEQERIWSAVEDIFDLVTSVDEEGRVTRLEDLAIDAMHSSSLDSYLDKKGFEIKEEKEDE